MTRQSLISLVTIPALLVAFAAPSFAAAKKAAPAKQVQAKSQAAKAAPAKTAAKAVELVDINSATKEQLAALPAIGDAYAQKIIDGRPYGKKSELKTRNILPAKAYTKVAKLIIAKQAAPLAK